MAEFDTTKIDSQYYGMRPVQGVVTPAAAYADPNSIGGLAELAEVGLDIGDKYNTVRVGAEAEQSAMDLADQYYQQSTGDFDQGIDAGNQRLVSSYKAGAVNPYEFKTRMQAEAQRQINLNPSKADVITAKMKQVFERTGITDRLAMDEAALEAEQKRIDEYRKARDKFLREERGIEPFSMPEEEVEMIYAQEMVDQQKYKALQNTNNMSKEEVKAFGNEVFDDMLSKGDFRESKRIIITGLTDELRGINDDPNLEDQIKIRRSQDAIATAKRRIRNIYGALDAIRKDNELVDQFFKNTDADFAALEVQFTGDFTGEDIKTRISNKAATAESEYKLEFLQSPEGKNQYKIKFFNQQLDLYTKQLQLFPEGPNRQAIIKSIQDTHRKLQGLLFGEELSAEDKGFIDNSEDYFNYLKSDLDNLAKENGIDIDKVPQTVVNALTKEQQHISSKSSQDKFAHLDKSFYHMSMMDDKRLREMMSNNKSKYRKEVSGNLAFYKSAINFYMLDTYEDLKGQLIVDKEQGRLYSDDPLVNVDLDRVNNYIAIMAKINNKDPKDMMDQVLKRDFPVLGFGGDQTRIVRVNDLVEWNNLEPGTKYMLPNGQVGIKENQNERVVPR